jgi:hypothetical protein
LTLVVLAAGRSTRYGKLKQLEPFGPGGEVLFDYAVYDALRAGFRRFVFVIADGMEPLFREHMAPLYEAGADVRFAVQHIWDVPPDSGVHQGRERPWGTAHAVWCARNLITGPFAVCNADDFYGTHAYDVLAKALQRESQTYLVGYPLGRTLSDHGGVSRGLIRADASGEVSVVEEAVQLLAVQDSDPPIARGLVRGEESVDVALGAPVSMNLWGFPPAVLDGLGRLFTEFLRATPAEEKEFYLSQAVGDLVQCGDARCHLLETDSTWLGVTFPDDRDRVASSLAESVACGDYPAPLSNAWKPLIRIP